MVAGAHQHRYVSAAILNVKDYVSKNGEAGTFELNNICTAHTFTMDASDGVKYSGCDIQSGQLRVLFHPNALGTLMNNALLKLANAVSAAKKPASSGDSSLVSFAARHSVKTS